MDQVGGGITKPVSSHSPLLKSRLKLDLGKVRKMVLQESQNAEEDISDSSDESSSSRTSQEENKISSVMKLYQVLKDLKSRASL